MFGSEQECWDLCPADGAEAGMGNSISLSHLSEQDPMVLVSPPPCPLSAFCLENFSLSISLIREVRNVETKENSQKRLNSKNVVTKHGQGPLVLSQAL